ncbi:MAG: hypothetical protein QJQ54_00105 [Mollicutes bacterium]|nr:MAG: hypothetical protein QJQ54_00105 [Mollicutes bacterium]
MSGNNLPSESNKIILGLDNQINFANSSRVKVVLAVSVWLFFSSFLFQRFEKRLKV